MRSLLLLVLMACGGGGAAPVTAAAAGAPPPQPNRPASPTWRPGDPIPCTTVDDCALVGPGHLACPGVCGFCPGAALAPKGHPPVTCPSSTAPSGGPPAAPPPDMPNCAACQEPPRVRAACSAGVCVLEPLDAAPQP